MGVIVAVDFGSTCTRLVAIDPAIEQVVATARAHSTVETDANVEFHTTLEVLRSQMTPGQHIARFRAASTGRDRVGLLC